MILAAVIAIAVVSFPYADVTSAVQKPSPASILKVAGDVAFAVVPFYPQARIAVVGVQIAAVMAKHPARNPIAEAQTSLGRGGRRA